MRCSTLPDDGPEVFVSGSCSLSMSTRGSIRSSSGVLNAGLFGNMDDGFGSGSWTASNDRTYSVVMPRMGSPRVAARSFLRTSCRLMLAAFRALACAIAYGS